MVLNKKIFYVMLFISFAGCGNNEPDNSSVYRTSFDSLNDTVGWIGISPLMFCSSEGKDYILIKNSSSKPAAKMELNIREEGRYKLSCTGKSDLNGGYICLKNNPSSHSEARCIYINSSDWKDYKSNEIYCSENSRVFIEVFAGGDIPSDLYLDDISLTR